MNKTRRVFWFLVSIALFYSGARILESAVTQPGEYAEAQILLGAVLIPVGAVALGIAIKQHWRLKLYVRHFEWRGSSESS